MKANKGEWSEFYAFLKVLSDRKLPAADKNLETMSDKFFVFHKVFRTDENGTKTYDLQGEKIVILDDKGEILKELEGRYIEDKAIKTLSRIKEAKTTTFEVPEAIEAMDESLCSQIKAKNTEKADLNAVIFDRISNKEEALGFSVKSMLGGASTLLNAGKTTNFVFRVSGLDEPLISKVNSINCKKSKIQKRLASIFENGGDLEFHHVLNDSFRSNLKKIDTVFHLFIAQMLLYFFQAEPLR